MPREMLPKKSAEFLSGANDLQLKLSSRPDTALVVPELSQALLQWSLPKMERVANSHNRIHFTFTALLFMQDKVIDRDVERRSAGLKLALKYCADLFNSPIGFD
ncbi:hypothetical protein DAPPUDRAFT_233660 [Daphnia pulex]|uniref:Uncharacterized protein n=1 Tax=Daphnia pulex TaxID=6669 RepID=E9FVD6_DAPPU|nr:hypothetical protein DAPPUDRAFT_233660 [Daphnia pulex]|eukprot:EFX89123.1 hypothetical protein DAPPUDRAFT_233660 [Daphnia pulex]